MDSCAQELPKRQTQASDSPDPTGLRTLHGKPIRCDCGHKFITHAPNRFCYSCRRICPVFDLRINKIVKNKEDPLEGLEDLFG